MTPLEQANATIKGLEAAISHIRRDEQRVKREKHRALAQKHDAYATIAEIKERLYECENQHEPFAELLEFDREGGPTGQEYDDGREMIMKALRYVVFGVSVV